MEFSWSEMLAHMGLPALIVAVVLAVMGLASLTVFIERVVAFRRSRASSKRFTAEVRDALAAGDLEQILAVAEAHARHGHLPRIVRSVVSTYAHALKTADVSGLTPVERAQRHTVRYMEDVGADLRRGLNVLSSVGSVAPFVGLLGTVLGIITAFQGIAAAGSGGLGAVSAGISEALVETAFGLAVAIPSVLAFNYLTGQIVRDEMALNNATGELLDMIEDWEERRAQARRNVVASQSGGAAASRARIAGA
jgi:biopolymer transport protein ExbB